MEVKTLLQGIFIFLNYLAGELDDWMIARKSILEISQNPTYERWEQYLHAIRTHAIITRSSFNQVWDFYPDDVNNKQQIIDASYLPEKWIK